MRQIYTYTTYGYRITDRDPAIIHAAFLSIASVADTYSVIFDTVY